MFWVSLYSYVMIYCVFHSLDPMSVCLCLCLSFVARLSLSSSLNLCLSFSVSLYLCLSVCVFLCLNLSLFLRLSVCSSLSVCMSISLFYLFPYCVLKRDLGLLKAFSFRNGLERERPSPSFGNEVSK